MKDLTNLRKIAEAEESHKYGTWAVSEDDWDGFCVYTNDGEPGIAYVAKDMHQGVSEGESTARFIATFDPPTALGLLTRLEQAEAAVARVREVCESDGYEVSNEFGTWDAVAVENIIDALDGEQG